jgi:hypothetical protein
MTRSGLKFRVLLSFAAACVFALPALADTIHLKDGGLIKGTIVGFTDGRFTVVVGEGARRREFTLSTDDVASIDFEPVKVPNETSRINTQQDPKIVPVSSRTSPKIVSEERRITPPPTETRRTATQPGSDTVRSTPPSVSGDQPAATVAPAATVKTVRTNSSPAPVSLNVKVSADNTANGWTNSGFVVKKGQRIRVTGDGTVSLGKGQSSTPAGVSEIDDNGKLLKAVPTGALIAVIGDDNNDFIYIGIEREFTAARDGALYLGVNEGNLNDNSGSYSVKIEVVPDSGS